MSVLPAVVVIVGLGLLMIVHEAGHLLAARAFGMRVTKFSIGIGPAIWRHQPKGSDTVYQLALIPLLAYVQIAGMNPFEEADPDDKGSYANASWFARVAAIFAGPFANYLFASVLAFATFVSFPTAPVETAPGTVLVSPAPGGVAAAAGLEAGDRIVAIGATPIDTFSTLQKTVLANGTSPMRVEVERPSGERLTLEMTPRLTDGRPLLGVGPVLGTLGAGSAALAALELPYRQTVAILGSLPRAFATLFTGGDSGLRGVVGLVSEGSDFVQTGGLQGTLSLLILVSIGLGAFNLLPVPALDGGRLVFLAYEAVTRRRLDAKAEARVHALGLMLLLALVVVVTFRDVRRLGGGTSPPASDESAQGAADAPAPSDKPDAAAGTDTRGAAPAPGR